MFNYQKLRCYQLTMDLAQGVPGIIAGWPSGTAYLQDQLKRALSSVVLNIAEGNGRRTLKERRRHFVIAQGSASETASIIDLALAYKLIEQPTHKQFHNNLLQVVKILSKLR